MTHTPSEDATILRVTAALFVTAVVALAGLALVGSLATVVDLADSTQSVASYAVLVTALLVAAIHARRDPGRWPWSLPRSRRPAPGRAAGGVSGRFRSRELYGEVPACPRSPHD